MHRSLGHDTVQSVTQLQILEGSTIHCTVVRSSNLRLSVCFMNIWRQVNRGYCIWQLTSPFTWTFSGEGKQGSCRRYSTLPWVGVQVF